MLDRIDGNGVRIVLVESSDRFARKMLTAELGILLLVSRGVTLMTAADENLTDTDDEMRVAFRQMAMTFAQLEKTRLVKKLRVARDRASQRAGRRVEGMKGYTRGNPTLVALAKEIRREGHTCWPLPPLSPSAAT
jgi:DNA invertase Pin-like site-specific DNA recombinase